MSAVLKPQAVGPDGLYSADDHMDLAYVPVDLWQSRVAAKWREKAPHVVKTSAGRTMWIREDRPWAVQGSKKADGRKVPFDEVGLPEEVSPGVFRAASAEHRLRDMDLDGIYAQVIYNFLDWGFEDPLLKEACLKAFNDWIADFCSMDRNRLIGLAVLPTHDPAACLAELERSAKLGLRGAMFEFTGATTPVWDPAWDPLWSAAEETGTAISFHIMTPGKKHKIGSMPKWFIPATASIACLMLKDIFVELVMSGVTERHPKLKLVMAESSLGWVPFLLERMEFEQHNYRHLADALPKRPAGEIFRSNFYCTFQEEKIGVQMIPHIGEDNVMWAADYPHGDGSFPRSRQAVDHIFEGVSPVIKRKATRDNMRRVYKIDA